ncbi:MAG: hypothetical protein KGJ57_10640 [Sphingomonadales bacterium]|nr:hypothetical protein [Sphingomonadales bacterium]MDE2169871.1 hypothetical protein [Sphingomonadales bacterium]
MAVSPSDEVCSTLYVLIAAGRVEIVKLGNSTLVITESLRRLIAERRGMTGLG